jgi:hypothetical protein
MNDPYETSTHGAASTARRGYTVRSRHASNAAAGGSQCSVRTGSVGLAFVSVLSLVCAAQLPRRSRPGRKDAT